MQITIVDNYQEMSRMAAGIVTEQLNVNPNTVLGLATGGTPVGMYEELVRMNKLGEVTFAGVTSFNLDEYVGLSGDHPCSYHHYMLDNLFKHVDMPLERMHIPNGQAEDLVGECSSYEEAIAKCGSIDLQVLGIGHNGHIGFNEPGTPFNSKTHVVELTSTTKEANARYFDSPDQVPTQAISMGIETIMSAKRILLLVSGKDKAATVASALMGDVTPDMPASILQNHPSVICILDRDAASMLPAHKGEKECRQDEI